MKSSFLVSDRIFGLTFGGLFGVFLTIGWFVFDIFLKWALGLSVIFIVLALVAPWVLLPLNRLWAMIGYRIGLLNNYLILGLLFFLMIVPVGLILRLLKYDPMERSFVHQAESYWTSVKRQANSETFGDMF